MSFGARSGRLARDRRITVIPGEEVKTDGQGEVIGLFLSEEIPRSMSFCDDRRDPNPGGIVYIPHPFDAAPSTASDAAPAPGGHRRLRGLQRAAPSTRPRR
jgi:predicted metal-dependent phosphoesterase TrpH